MRGMTLRKWYGSSITIPHFKSRHYATFAGSCMGIVNSLINRYIKTVHVSFNNVASASADRPSGIININSGYLSGKIRGEQLEVDQTLTIINGLILHEAGHFAESPDDLTPFTDFIRKHTKCVYNEDIAARLGNIIEDIYIEAWIDRTVPSVSWMLEAMNDFDFSSQNLEWVFNSVADQTQEPETMEQVVNVLNVLLIAKVLDFIDSNPYIEGLFTTIRTATIASNLEQRLELTLALYDRIMPCMTEEECNNKDNKKMLEELRELVEGLTAPHEGEVQRKGISTDDSTLGRGVAKLIDDLAETEITLIPEEPEESELDFAPTTLFIERTPSLSAMGIEADERYQRLAEIARQNAVVNRPYGEDRSRGRTIRKVHRIATDGKIFAEPLPMRHAKPMQVMIVVDCSSSMGGENIHNACKAALGAANGLVEGRCDVSVFGHTADTLGDTEVIIYRFKDFNEPISVLPHRLYEAVSMIGSVRLCQNRDSYAISYLSKKLRDRSKRRLMIVISDGCPSAIGYGGTPANQHTKDMVEQSRKEGVEIISISIEEHAADVNNFIYGKENNVFNTDPNVIEQIVRRLIVN